MNNVQRPVTDQLTTAGRASRHWMLCAAGFCQVILCIVVRPSVRIKCKQPINIACVDHTDVFLLLWGFHRSVSAVSLLLSQLTKESTCIVHVFMKTCNSVFMQTTLISIAFLTHGVLYRTRQNNTFKRAQGDSL